MSILQRKGEEAIDAIIDLLDPVSEVIADKDFAAQIQAKQFGKAIKTALKHKKAILTIMAIYDEADPETYAPTLAEIPGKFMKLINDPEMMRLFRSVAGTENGSSDSPSENIKGEKD